MTWSRFVVALALAGLFGVSSVAAQTVAVTPSADTTPEVLVVVNGTSLTRMHYDQLLQLFSPQARAMASQNKGRVLRELVLQELLAQEGRRLKIDQDPEMQARIQVQLNSIIARSVIQKYVNEKSGIDEDKIRSYYEEHKADYMETEKISASHILVKTEDEAQAVLEELEQGKDFAELAKEKSTGPSAPKGGELGSFERGRMVPAFDQAAFAMQAGEVSAPVQTRFGWHVIKVTERTPGKQKSYDDAKGDIRQVLVAAYIQSVLEGLNDKADVDIKDPSYQY